MIKVFFADGGTLEQLHTTLERIADASDARLADLEGKIDENASGDVPFPDRLPLNTIGLRFVVDHERLIGTWARWARAQTAEWQSPTDAGRWRYADTFKR